MSNSELKVPSKAEAAASARRFLKDSHLDIDIDETSAKLGILYRTPDKTDKVGCPCFVFRHSCCIGDTPAEEFYVYVKAFGRSRTMVVKMQQVETCVLEEIPAGSTFAFSGKNWYYDGICIAEDL